MTQIISTQAFRRVYLGLALAGAIADDARAGCMSYQPTFGPGDLAAGGPRTER
jgi:hypothetical protein